MSEVLNPNGDPTAREYGSTLLKILQALLRLLGCKPTWLLQTLNSAFVGLTTHVDIC